jgi:uncharacterized protein
MVIDGHLHLIPGRSRELIADMDRLAIDKTVIVGVTLKDISRIKVPNKFFLQNRLFRKVIGVQLEKWMTASRNFQDNLLARPDNAVIAQACAEYPGRLFGFLFINPTHPQTMDELNLSLSGECWKGIKLAQRQYPVDLAGENMRLIAEFACAHSLPVFIHLGFEKKTYDIEPLAAGFPDLVIIVAHLGIQYFEKALGWAKRFKNVYLDTSSNFATTAMVEEAVSRAGAEKLFMGSDSPILGDQPTALEKISSARIKEGEKKLIMGENLAALLKI